MTKKILALLLAVLMLVPVFAACNETPDTPDTPDNPGTPVDTDNGDDKQPEDTAPTGLVLDKTDFGGAKLRVLGISESLYLGYYTTDRRSDRTDPDRRIPCLRYLWWCWHCRNTRWRSCIC